MAEQITQVLGIVGIKHCGAYDATIQYEKLNVVTYQGSSYCAKGNTLGNLPTNTEYWDLMAEKGDKGDKGDTGEEGYTPVKGIDYYTAADKAELESTLSSDVSDEVSEQLSTLTSATPLAASSIAGMTDTTRIYVNTADGHWYWYNGSAWTDGGEYLSDPIQDYILNFIENLQSIDTTTMISTLEEGKYINGGNGNEGTYVGQYASDYVEIKVTNVKYILDSVDTNIINASGAFGMACYDEDHNVLMSLKYTDSTHTNTTLEFTPPIGTKYVRFSIRNVPSVLKFYVASAYDVYTDILNRIATQTALLKDFENIDITKELTIGGYINYNNGDYATIPREDLAATEEYTPILPIPFTLKSSNKRAFNTKDNRGLAFYDTNKDYISGIQYDSYKDTIAISDVPENACYIRYTITNYTSGDTLNITYDNIYDMFNILNDRTKMVYTIKSDYLSCFLNVGVIGDSFASGCTKVKNQNDEGVFVDFYNHSWPQYLARKLGTNYTNYSRGGATTTSFITNTAYGLPKIVADAETNPCELYLIGLGINDSWNLSTLGTVDDIGTESATYYGRYSKIIETIKELHPTCVIMCMTMPTVSPATNRTAYNGAIEDIVEYYSSQKVYLIDCANINQYNSQLWEQYRNGHLDALGYSLSADILHEAINDVIYNNLEDFKDIESINTEYSYTP